MAEFTPDELVKLGLERALVSDALSREKKKKRQETAILPVFMGKNGKVRQLGQGESNALILPNRYYQEGEPMNPQPVGKGGLIAVDNKSYFVPASVPVEPLPQPVGKILGIATNQEQFTVVSNEFNTSSSISGSAIGVIYSFPDFTFIPFNDSDPVTPSSPLILDPLVADPDGGIGTITASNSSPFLGYKIDFTGATDCSLIFSNSEVSVTSFDPDDPLNPPPFSITLRLRSYASQDGGGFDLIVDSTQTFDETTSLSEPMFPNPFACNILEGYVTWEFL